MTINTTLAGLSQNPALNGPDGAADLPSQYDDAIRNQGSFIAQLRDGVGFTGQLGYKNRVFNGNFAVNQRVVSGTVVLAAGAYGHDRWKAGAAGCTYTFSTSGQDTTINISSGSLQQVIEGANIEGGNYIMSWAGTAQGKIGAGAYGATGVAGTGTAGTNLTVELNTGTFTRVQLESGTSVSAFERRPYGYELQLCQRYYRQLGETRVAIYAGAIGTYQQALILSPMRAVPTVSLGLSSNTNANSISLSLTTDGAAFYQWSAPGVGSSFFVMGGITLSAEL